MSMRMQTPSPWFWPSTKRVVNVVWALARPRKARDARADLAKVVCILTDQLVDIRSVPVPSKLLDQISVAEV